jgi:hypothetical protein
VEGRNEIGELGVESHNKELIRYHGRRNTVVFAEAIVSRERIGLSLKKVSKSNFMLWYLALDFEQPA